ncbi:hypothetical protein KM1_279800 [Entamoeba histolytica HM-3:IMSS]|uniref:Uncharacterized protein n=1 Tax=Entamoeba histolytica HM-3:IMSS TaxID=885315 RepID=M7VXY4_ENTHI|nr:hypothetical protein KM1_279800 [Entamoeba histolytica HM-3:IMSS]
MSIQSISASLENPRARRIASEHAFKNGFCFEQGVLLYLLNQYYDLVIKRQPKRSTLTLSCPHVESIQFEDEILERINRVFYKNKLMLDCKQIHQLGNKINNYLLSLVETKKSFFIKQGDETLHQFWEEEIKEKCILE